MLRVRAFRWPALSRGITVCKYKGSFERDGQRGTRPLTGYGTGRGESGQSSEREQAIFRPLLCYPELRPLHVSPIRCVSIRTRTLDRTIITPRMRFIEHFGRSGTASTWAAEQV